MEILTLFCAFLVILLCLTWFKLSGKHHRLPPGPKGNFFFGHALEPWMQSKYLMDIAKKYGDIFHLRVFNYTVVVVNSYEAIREALSIETNSGRVTSSFSHEVNKGGYGLVFAEGQLWRDQRRFSLSVLRDLGFGKSRIELTIQDELEHLRRFMQQQKERPFSPEEVFATAASNVISSIVFGERCSEEPGFSKIVELMRQLGQVKPRVAFFAVFWPLVKHIPADVSGLKQVVANRDGVSQFITKKVQQHRDSFNPNDIRDYIDSFLLEMDNGINTKWPSNSFKIEQLVEGVFELFLGGTDTTSTTLMWAVIFLAKNPDVQRKAHLEIDRTIGSSKLPDTSDRSKMRYIDAVVHEVSRYATLLPTALPHRATEDVQLCGYDVPKDSIVLPNIEFTHRTGRWWKSPDRFDPENFLDADGNLINTQYMLAFSTGKRVCLGETLARQELFIFLTGLLQKFEFAEDADHPLPGIDDCDHDSAVHAPRRFQIIARERVLD